MKIRPKKDLKSINLTDKSKGYERRLNYAKEILSKETVFPKPLEYEDIDNSFFNFIETKLDFEYEGVKFPTFKLYSNQIFSEYSQEWSHVDEFNNLIMNFKTVNRENNPKGGSNQGNYWNIPGERDYTLLIRDVLDDNGTESYEIYSMKQPYSVDLLYRVNFITNKFEKLNEFNQKVNDLFKSRQCYIRPNGHYIPLLLEEINDDTSYSIGDRKFFSQSCVIKALGYIIQKKDFKITKRPKRVRMLVEGISANKSPEIEVYEDDNDKIKNRNIEVVIPFKPYYNKCEFIFDTNMIVNKIDITNIRNYRFNINGTLYYTDKGFELKKDDNVKIRIRPLIDSKECKIVLNGYSPDEFYEETTLDNIDNEQIKNENILIE